MKITLALFALFTKYISSVLPVETGRKIKPSNSVTIIARKLYDKLLHSNYSVGNSAYIRNTIECNGYTYLLCVYTIHSVTDNFLGEKYGV